MYFWERKMHPRVPRNDRVTEGRFRGPAGCLEASQTEAYEVGLKGVVVGQGDTYEEALSDVKSAFVFMPKLLGMMCCKPNGKNPLEIRPMEIANRVTIDEKIRSGEPVMKGTRVPVDLVLGKLAGGMTHEEIMAEYELTKEDILAAVNYAAKRMEEE
jgi:uncharacterized protein (DUF433 family)